MRERETPSIAHSGQGWARLKLAAWNVVKVSLVGGRDPAALFKLFSVASQSALTGSWNGSKARI